MKDIKIVYTQFFQDGKKYIDALPILIMACALYALIYRIYASFTAIVYIPYFVGLVRWFIDICCMTHFATLMSRLFLQGKLSFEDLYRFDSSLFPPLTQTFFSIYLIRFLLSRFGISFLGVNVGILLLSVWDIFTAPALEVCYLGHESSARVLPSLWELWKVNFLALLPYTIIVLGLYTLSPSWSIEILGFVISFIAKACFWYTKAILFRILYFSNPRARTFHHMAE